MIVCPICKEEIDDDSHYCDQCGQALFFCQQCGRVGVGRRCTYCGGLMVSPDGNRHAGVPTGSITGYVSGVHAQLKYLPKVGWCVVDKHSSNGTKLNQRQVQPDVDMTLKNGDILTLANVNLQVNIR